MYTSVFFCRILCSTSHFTLFQAHNSLSSIFSSMLSECFLLNALIGWCFAPFIVLLGCSLTPTIILFCVLGIRINVISESFGDWSLIFYSYFIFLGFGNLRVCLVIVFSPYFLFSKKNFYFLN